MIQFIAGLFVGAGLMFVVGVYFIFGFIDTNELGGYAEDVQDKDGI